MTAKQLQDEWPHWSYKLRREFCMAFNWLHQQADFGEMVRFIMESGGPTHWPDIAGIVAWKMPQEEAYRFLNTALRSVAIQDSANLVQAIAITKHCEARQTLLDHLDRIWRDPNLWNSGEGINWIAFSATCCIRYLIELCSAPIEFEYRVQKLFKESPRENRDLCRQKLGKHYPQIM